MIDILGILDVLPHRYPFLLVDRILEMDGERVLALKNVTFNEPHFTGHFPHHPVMPGVLIMEALAQAAGILAFKTAGEKPHPGSLFMFAGIDEARFKRQVLPGDTLVIECDLKRAIRGVGRFICRAHVGEQLVCEASLLAAIRDRPA